MALFGGSRDVDLIRKINREFLGDIINQQCALYLHRSEETKTNIYGEAAEGYNFEGPYLFNVLITRDAQSFVEDNMLIDVSQRVEFHFFRDDLVDANVVPSVGDYILYEENYHLINDIIANQRFTGRNPDFPNNSNPLNPGLENFGTNVSITCITNVTPGDRVGITRERYQQ